MTLILATSSLFRRRLFEKHCSDYIVQPNEHFEQFVAPDIDEKAIRDDDPAVLCQKIAEAKCDAVLRDYRDRLPANAVILTFDQVVVCGGQLREKPEDEQEARAFLKSYAHGEPAIAYCGVLAHDRASGTRKVTLDKVTVKFTNFPDSVVDHLVQSGEIFQASGSFTVEDRELGKYVETMDGSVDAMEGLPLEAIKSVIRAVCGDEITFPPEKPIATITHVIFDMDGLLLDTESMYSVAQQKLLDPFNIKFSYEVKAMMMGKKAVEAVEIMLNHYNLDLDAEKFTKDRENLLDQMFPSCDMMPGALRLLLHLKAHGVPMAIATSSHKRHYLAKTTRHKQFFDSVFSHVITGDSVVKSKPDPEIFLSALEKFDSGDVDPGKALVFEDAPLGVEAAIRAGMRVAWVYDQNEPNDLMKADCKIKSLLHFKPELFSLPRF